MTKKNNNKIQIKFSQPKENQICQKEFFKFLKITTTQYKSGILTAIIFLNIAALHHYPYSIFLYYLGKLSLYKSLKKNVKLNKKKIAFFDRDGVLNISV